jgi:hypothetical protein
VGSKVAGRTIVQVEELGEERKGMNDYCNIRVGDIITYHMTITLIAFIGV